MPCIVLPCNKCQENKTETDIELFGHKYNYSKKNKQVYVSGAKKGIEMDR